MLVKGDSALQPRTWTFYPERSNISLYRFQLARPVDHQAGSYFPLPVYKIYLAWCIGRQGTWFRRTDITAFPWYLLISPNPTPFGEIWGPDVDCICGSNRSAAVFSVLSVTRPSSASPLVFVYPHPDIPYPMVGLCDRSLQGNNGNEAQSSASNEESLLFKACLHSAGVRKKGKATQIREITVRWCKPAHIWQVTFPWWSSSWLGLSMQSYKTRSLNTEKLVLMTIYPPQGKSPPLSSAVLLLLLAQSLTTTLQSLGHCFVSIFFILSQAQKE